MASPPQPEPAPAEAGLESMEGLVLDTVISRAGARPAAALACASTRLRTAVADDSLWRRFCAEDLGLDAPVDPEGQPLPSCQIAFTKDLAEDSPCPWYKEIDPGHFSWANFSNSRVRKFITHAIVATLEFLRIAPKGRNRLFSIMQTATHGLVTGSREEILTVTFFVLGRKPLKE